jgi:MoaA/NifB/PqqE/SkfB family radical SAM enzyme
MNKKSLQNQATASELLIRNGDRQNHRNTITRRFDINMGFKCNLRCKFCYYLDEIKNKTTHDADTEEVKRRLRFGRTWGKTAVDLTGGEPTVRKDLPELIAYAREIGYETVCIITNGWVIGSNENYLSTLIDAGLNDILLSLHGATAAKHEGLTGKKDSHARLLKAAKRVATRHELNMRFNYVVCQENIDEVEAVADLMVSFEPSAINFILFHPTRDAAHANGSVKFENYDDAVAPVIRVIKKYADQVPHINVRDIPYCLMKGYEKHTKPLYQLQYEKVEWDYCLDVLFKKKRMYYLCSLAIGALMCVSNPYFWKADLDNKKHMALQRARIYTMRAKGPQCRRCAVRHICDGLAKEYVHNFGSTEMQPYAGDTIYNPTYFMSRDEIEA